MEIISGEKQYEVSIIVACYNFDINKLERTLNSLMTQREVSYEIIIADDGSKNNMVCEIENYFKQRDFKDYKLVLNSVNMGTVLNVYSGASVAVGSYTKTISPGDCIYGDFLLRNWIDFIEAEGSMWSFCDAVYYQKEKKQDKIISVKANPQSVNPYLARRKQNCRWNYIVLKDIALGACMLAKTSIFKEYLEKICGKVKYAEDNIWRMMMFDGIIGSYYPMNGVLYEYGTGISTSNSEAWAKSLLRDWSTTDQIMFDENRILDEKQRKMKNAVLTEGKIRKLFIKGKLLHRFRLTFYPRMTISMIPISEGEP